MKRGSSGFPEPMEKPLPTVRGAPYNRDPLQSHAFRELSNVSGSCAFAE